VFIGFILAESLLPVGLLAQDKAQRCGFGSDLGPGA